jgi:hypothetical protein
MAAGLSAGRAHGHDRHVKIPGTRQRRVVRSTNNTFTDIGGFANSGKQRFTPPGNNSAGDEDWLLLIEAE